MTKAKEIRDGTWTVRVTDNEDGIWSTVLDRLWVINPRFKRARFVLAGGPTILVSARDLDKALDETMAPGKMRCLLKLDPHNRSINGQAVNMELEV